MDEKHNRKYKFKNECVWEEVELASIDGKAETCFVVVVWSLEKTTQKGQWDKRIERKIVWYLNSNGKNKATESFRGNL